MRAKVVAAALVGVVVFAFAMPALARTDKGWPMGAEGETTSPNPDALDPKKLTDEERSFLQGLIDRLERPRDKKRVEDIVKRLDRSPQLKSKDYDYLVMLAHRLGDDDITQDLFNLIAQHR